MNEKRLYFYQTDAKGSSNFVVGEVHLHRECLDSPFSFTHVAGRPGTYKARLRGLVNARTRPRRVAHRLYVPHPSSWKLGPALAGSTGPTPTALGYGLSEPCVLDVPYFDILHKLHLIYIVPVDEYQSSK